MKEKISQEQIKYIANLANLDFSDGDLKKLAKQMSGVIEFNISRLNKIRTENVAPTAHALGLKSDLRKDETEPGLTIREVLQNSKETHQNFFKVKAVLGNSDVKK